MQAQLAQASCLGRNTNMEELTYNYDLKKPNRLLWVDDAEGDVPDADDLGDQEKGNYQYNSIGQLTKDVSGGITYIYTASGLVAEVLKNGEPLVKFFYNDRNQRVKKEHYAPNNFLFATTYYVRDVAGQVMAVYNDVGGDPALEEQPVYGTGRIGVAYNGNNNEKTYVYELTDHLGNVRAVFTKSNDDANLEGYTDYYPFGMPMPNRNLEDANGYRYGYQGQYAEEDKETGLNAFELRMYDSRIGRWTSPDPYGQFHSPYIGMGNNPISRIDPTGGSTDGCCDDDWVSNGLNELDGVTMTGTDMSGGMMRGLAGMDFSFSAPLLMSQQYTMNTPLWEFSGQIEQFKVDAQRLTADGRIPSAYMVQGYINSYENSAYLDGRTYVTPQDIEDVDGAMGDVAMSIVPVGRLFELAGKGYTIIRTIGRFTVFEKTVKASNLPGQALAKYTKVFNQEGKLVKMYKDAYKIDGRHYERAFYKPKSFGRTRKLN
ncbi:RHS repeat domain-containing protein [Flagellimonas sp. C4]|uniref:RHS repeat domain-containing protein n=1 Tax=Flagellimonas alginolytica TaxID=3177515 RepID=UPI0035C91617